MPTLAQKWIDQGIEQGIEQGTLGSQARTLRSLIHRRFGSVPAAVKQRIAASTVNELSSYIDNIFDAKSAKAVVGIS